MKLSTLKPLTKEYLESIGFLWNTEDDDSSYFTNEILHVSEEEAEAYYEAANELYDMFCEAGDYVVENNLFHELGIPFNLVDTIKRSWENDVHWHLYSRFDLAGGIDGKPIKLLEFNADTPTNLFESAIIQWALLKQNGLDESRQFNNIYEAIRDNFKRLLTLDEDISEFESLYEQEQFKMLFSSISTVIEDENTTKLLQYIAKDAGFITDFEYMENVEFDDEGIYKNGQAYELWFKLIPWEDIGIDEGDLALILNDIIKNQKAIIFNPAYTLMFQSKAMLKILWDLYPNHPLLLETSFEPLKGKKQVEKRFFGREGANIKIINEDGSIDEQTDGLYEEHKAIYQEYTSLPTDDEGNSYLAGVFYAYESCGLSFRRGGKITDDMSKFISHIIS